MTRLRSAARIAILLSFPGLAAHAGEVHLEPEHRLDEGLADAEGFVGVFVRMEDQLFGKGGDYERFCQAQPESTKRLELRHEVVATLKLKGERSFAPLQDALDGLVERNAIRGVYRYWIVNGFACEATAEGCAALADLPGIGFVYRQRFAPQHRRKRDEGYEANDELDGLYRRMTKELEKSGEEPFDPEAVDAPWNLRTIGAEKAWLDHGVTGEGVVVAVLDDGMMPVPALTPALWRNEGETLNGKDDDGNGYVDDVFGYHFGKNTPYSVTPSGHRHGTLCASVIASRPTLGADAGAVDASANRAGDDSESDWPLATGVAPRAKIMPLVGSGQLRAYEYALNHGADVLSMSYTFEPIEMGQYRGLFRTAHEHLAAAGILSVGGAGNYAERRPAGTQIGSPKDIPCVLAAAGVGPSQKVTAFSSRGPVSWAGIRYYDGESFEGLGAAKPDVTTCNSGLPMWTLREVWKGSKADRLEKVVAEDAMGYILVTGPRGNSFAGPHTAGVAALMLEANPELPVWEVQRLMIATCADMGEPGHDVAHGAGMLQAGEAVKAVRAD